MVQDLIVEYNRNIIGWIANGTIGGGLVEALVMDACLELIDKHQSRIKEFSLNRELKDGLDMVCGGNLINKQTRYKYQTSII